MIIDALQYSNWSRPIFEQMREGGLDCVHVTIAYHENCVETIRNIAKWNQLFEQHGDLITLVGSSSEVVAAREAGKTGVMFGFQNCSPIEDDYSLVEVFHTLGVRFMQLSYNNQSLLASGCHEYQDNGITRFGKQVIREMNRVGMVVDMSHSGERSTLETIDYSSRPIAITHANPASFEPVVRNKSDETLKALASSDGMLGFSLYPHHLKNGSKCLLKDFCNMVASTAELIGVDHLGIGSDLCQHQPDWVLDWMRNGRWNKDSNNEAAWVSQPDWFDNCTDYGNIAEGLVQAGFSNEEVAKIMGGNWLDFFERSCTAMKP